jgi:hypothetical protein
VPSVFHFAAAPKEWPDGPPTMPGVHMYVVDTCEKFCLQAGTACVAAWRGEDTCGEWGGAEMVPCNAPFDVSKDDEARRLDHGHGVGHMCECSWDDMEHLAPCLDGYDSKYGDEGTICPAGKMVDGPNFHGMMVRTIADMEPTAMQTIACPEGYLGSVTVMCGAGGQLCPMWNDCQPLPSEMCHSVGAACFTPKGDATDAM